MDVAGLSAHSIEAGSQFCCRAEHRETKEYCCPVEDNMVP